MGLFGFGKKNKVSATNSNSGNKANSASAKKFKKLRVNAINELRAQVADNNSIINFDAGIDSSVKEFVKSRKIKNLVSLRVHDLDTAGKPSIKYSPLVEAVVNFIYTDMCLLDAQGDTDHTFEDSVDNMIFVMY